ncbi:hypothetical protein T01_6814 [Trichinella spiralis]|uniref:Uncharacterized protein n=1 Tax=Trichinella spiralis TaxID=6334 RepID=A0A0V1B3Q4_TRISP|nr:hypothetical protein T01_6814 [Trichinella spiralis]
MTEKKDRKWSRVERDTTSTQMETVLQSRYYPDQDRCCKQQQCPKAEHQSTLNKQKENCTAAR